MNDEKQMPNASFLERTQLIQSARQRAYRAVNTEPVNLYWQVGETIRRKIESDGWGKTTISVINEGYEVIHEPA